MSNLAMVQELKRTGYLSSAAVEKAMLAADRALFVSQNPYADLALPVGHGQTISAPGVVAFMLEQIDVKPGMKVLEVGSGSGYNAALLSVLAGPKGKVISIEIIPELSELAGKNLARAGFTENIELVIGDGSCGHEKEAPYDRIIVTAAMPHLSEDHPLIAQLKDDGRLVAPVGERYYQDLVVYDKKTHSSKKVLPVIFVPLIGKYGFRQGDD